MFLLPFLFLGSLLPYDSNPTPMHPVSFLYSWSCYSDTNPTCSLCKSCICEHYTIFVCIVHLVDIYSLRKLATGNVIILLPCGQHGNSSTFAIAANMILLNIALPMDFIPCRNVAVPMQQDIAVFI